MRVSQVRARVVDDAADHEPVLTLLAVHDGSGGRERHHRVRVHVEDEPSGRADAKGQGGERRAEIGRSEVVEAVKGADRGVVFAFDGQCGKRRSYEPHLRREPSAGAGEHRLGTIQADHLVPQRSELACEQPGAAADVEHVVHAVLVIAPELVEEGRPGTMAGIDDDLVIDPRQPGVRLDLAHVARNNRRR